MNCACTTIHKYAVSTHTRHIHIPLTCQAQPAWAHATQNAPPRPAPRCAPYHFPTPPPLPVPSPFREFYGRPKFICKFNRSQCTLWEFFVQKSSVSGSSSPTVSWSLSPNFILPRTYPPLNKSPHLCAFPSQMSGSISSFQ